jgi:hypothetical protein
VEAQASVLRVKLEIGFGGYSSSVRKLGIFLKHTNKYTTKVLCVHKISGIKKWKMASKMSKK